MSVTRIDVEGGSVAAHAFGGTGRDVLMVHSLGFSGMNLAYLAGALAEFCRPFTFDMPGHACSTAPMRDAADQWRHIATVTRELGLDRPLLVGHDTGAWAAMVAAAHEPELFSGLVLIGGPVARSVDDAREHFALVETPEFQEMLRERFLLGATGVDEVQRAAFTAAAAQRIAADWMLEGIDLSLVERDVAHSIVTGPEELWVHTPTVETVVAGSHFADGADFPAEALYATLTLPTWIVQLTEGFDAHLSQHEREIVAGNPLVHIEEVESGQYAPVTDADTLAPIIGRALAETAGVSR